MKNNPFAIPGRFYRGNLHTHSTNSDGLLPVQEVCQRYEDAGYDFIALTEHFHERYDFPLTDSRPFRNDNFTTLIAAELHQGKIAVGENWHILAVGLPVDFAKPTPGETALQISERAAATGAFIGIVHPSWYGLTIEDARSIPCAHAIETYNHGSEVEAERGDSWGFYDQLLNEGWRLSGFATDDSHSVVHDMGGGWVNVRANSLDPEAIVQSLKAGHYYSSQGPEIHDLQIADGQLKVKCSAASNISLQGRGRLSVYVAGEGLTKASFETEIFEPAYVRVTVRDANGKKAWSNPVWFSDLV